MGTARDIVEHCGVARFLFVDFPLGSPCGAPGDGDMQRRILAMALDLLESAEAPRSTVRADLQWPGGEAWKETVFTEAQPFLEGEVESEWLKQKALYRELRAEGKV